MPTDTAPPAGPEELPDALQRLRQLLEQKETAIAEREAAALLEQLPDHRDLMYLHAVALRRQSKIPEALAALAALEEAHPSYPRLYQERGHCHVAQRNAPDAIAAFTRAVELNPALPASWRLLESLYRMAGRPEDARVAGQHVATLAKLPVEVVTARSMVADGNLREAEEVIRQYLRRAPRDIEAMRVLAMVAQKNDFAKDATILLEAVLQAAPDYHPARHDYVLALMDLHRYKEAREQIEKLIQLEPARFANRVTLASILVGLGETREAIELYRQLLREKPGDPEINLSLGHALKTEGLRRDSEEAYREAARLRPNFGDAYWSLANLKTYRFSDEQIVTMREHIHARRTPDEDRVHLCFALAKALEDRGDYEESFRFYDQGNTLRRLQSPFQADTLERTLREQAKLCTRQFFEERAGWGCPDPAPIFIVGLPRAGSTLIEQILASHSKVEGTMELADIPRLAAALDLDPTGARYPGMLEKLTADDCRRFGENYLLETKPYRAEGREFFIDKMPNNFRHVSLIHLILPNAKIIDARRAPMACCFSNFKQLFASGQQFTYGLEEIARYYRMYVEVMAHWDTALPGRILRVQHEDVIADLEGSVRRLLAHCGLPFEQACVEFHKTERRVHTASSEQVRRPINREGVDQWRNFEPWLGELRAALGPLAGD
jgi:tetratricopeptide (TPR) repeat protein